MRTNEDHFSSLVLMRTKSSIEDLYESTGYTGKIQVYNQKLQNYKIEPIELVKCNFSKINSSFCGGTITLYTVCAMCSDTVHFMQFTGLAFGLIVPSSIIMHKITKIRALHRQFSSNARMYGHARINTGDLVHLTALTMTTRTTRTLLPHGMGTLKAYI